VRTPGQTFAIKRISFVCEGEFLFLKLPSGRRIAYPFPRLVTNGHGNSVVMFKDNEQGKWVDCRHGQGAYGGTWIENAVQAVARDLFAAAMMRLEDAGYPIVLHVHDEIVAERPDGFGTTEEFLKLITTLPAWAEGLPVAAKVREGQRFCKIKAPEKPESPEPSDAPLPNEPDAPDEPDKPERTEPAVGETRGKDMWQASGNEFRGYQSGEEEQGKPVTIYIYKNERGEPYLRVVRKTSPKRFPQAFRVNGQWVTKKPAGWVNIPYRLPEIIAAKPDDTIWICEGEKDADNVAAHDLVATSNPEGAGKWTDELNKWFLGKQRVNILEDNDDAGRAHALKVAAAIHGVGVPDVRIISFPELPEHDDVSDWLAQGHTKDELLARAKAARRWEPPKLRSKRASQYEMQALEWLWRYRVAKGALNVLAGLPDKSKGLTWCNIVARVTIGGVWPADEGRAPKGNVIIFSAEDDIARTVIPRLAAAGADLERVEIIEMMGNPDGSDRMFNLVTDLPALKAKLQEVGDVVLVIIDPVAAYLGVGKVAPGSGTDVRGVLTPLTKLAEEKQTAILAVMHFNKKAEITNALLRISDSIAYAAIGRSIYVALDDPDNEDAFLFVKAKCNLAPRDLPALRYTIANARQVGFDKKLNKPIEAPFIVWDENGVQITALEAMEAAAGGMRGNAKKEAEDFLCSKLANGPVLADEIYAEAKACCIAIATLRRAKRDLNIISEKEHGTTKGGWCWRLPVG
jgi:putative DNA primase/helicase